MRRHEISDDHWSRIEHLLPGRPGGHGGVAGQRGFVNAVWYVAKTGIPCDLPDRFGTWDTVFHRFNAWCERGVWKRVFEAVRDPDLEWLMIDATVIRAHHHAAGMNGGADDQALGRSRGGFGTKIHLAVDALGLPPEIRLSPGQDADITYAETLLGDHRPEAVLGDKGYDTDAFAKAVGTAGPRSSFRRARIGRRRGSTYDEVVYKERNTVERCINRLKQFRRIATRYEKTARNFLGMVLFAAVTLWLQ